MISTGNDITSRESLERIDVERLYSIISNQEDHLKTFTMQLRKLQDISKAKYTEMKKLLPYFVCSLFNPAYRKTENFLSSSYFALDIDHIAEHDINIEELKSKLQKDERLLLMYMSASANGLKLMFQLDKKCTDPYKYKLFYTEFARQFSLQYQLSEIMDFSTSDATRAHFICSDAHAYFNPICLEVDAGLFINFDNATEVSTVEKLIPTQTHNETINLGKEKLDAIKKILNPEKIKPKNDPFVPQELDRIYRCIEEKAKVYDIRVELVKNIQYGKQIAFHLENLYAEINLYYGKSGYRIVSSAKSRCSREFNDLMKQIIELTLHDSEKLEKYSEKVAALHTHMNSNNASNTQRDFSGDLPNWSSGSTVDSENLDVPF